MRKIVALALAMMISNPLAGLFAQKENEFKLKVSAYVDTYFATDNWHKSDKENRAKLNSLNIKKEEFDINTAQVNFSGSNDNYRMGVTLFTGRLQQNAYENLTAYKFIQEANAGVKLADKLWLDAGLFLTHIGGESMMPKDNWFSSHAIVTNYEPFYQAGAKLSYDFNESFSSQIWLMNGYGIFEDNNDNKTLGYFLNYKANEQLNLSLAGTVGNEMPREVGGLTRIYNNVVVSYIMNDDLSLKLSADLGKQDDKSVMGAFLAARYNLMEQLSLSVRGEFYNDEDGMLSSIGFENNTAAIKSMIGATLGLEYRPNSNSYIRLEGRYLQFDEETNKVFLDQDMKPTNTRMETVLNFGIYTN